MSDLDDEIEEMMKQLAENFNTADEEQVTENSYRFKGKRSEMRKDILMMKSINRGEKGRLYTKKKAGFD